MRERATHKFASGQLIPTRVNGKVEMLPEDPQKVALILRDRKKNSPAAIRTRMLAAFRKRGIRP